MSSSPEGLGHLLALVAHELRSPTTVVSGSLRLLIDGRVGPLTDSQRALLRPADSSSRRLVKLLDDLSELGRLYRGEATFRRRRIVLADVVRRAADAFVPAAESAIRVQAQVELDGELIADPDRLARALTAFCAAAARGLGPEGTIVMASEKAGADADTVGLTIEPGLGEVAARRLAGVADPFDAFEGVGLELPIARAVIAAEGGVLTVEPARIAVRLPLAPASSAA